MILKSEFIPVFVILISLASATPEAVPLGPYFAIFDLNTSMNYTIKYCPTLGCDNPERYGFNIITNDELYATIMIINYKDLKDSNLNIDYYDCLFNRYENYSVDIIAIDSKLGLYAHGYDSAGNPISKVCYWLDNKECDCGPVSVGSTKVEIHGKCPLSIIESLIKSIRVIEQDTTEQVVEAQSDSTQALTNESIVLITPFVKETNHTACQDIEIN